MAAQKVALSAVEMARRRQQLSKPATKPETQLEAQPKAQLKTQPKAQPNTQPKAQPEAPVRIPEIIPAVIPSVPVIPFTNGESIKPKFQTGSIHPIEIEPIPSATDEMSDSDGPDDDLSIGAASTDRIPPPNTTLSNFSHNGLRPSGKSRYLTNQNRELTSQEQSSIPVTSLNLFLEPGENVAPIGVYDLSVISGSIFLYGARIDATIGRPVRVYAPSSHPIPVISCELGKTPLNPAEAAPAKVELRSIALEDQLPSILRPQNRLFDRIFDCVQPGQLSRDTFGRVKTFEVPVTVEQDPLSRNIAPLTLSASWEEAILGVKPLARGPNPVILIGGGRQTGKSTLSRLLTNSLLTHHGRSSNLPSMADVLPPVFFLDLDPSDQEFGPDNQISLTLVRNITAGPQYTHSVPGNGNSNELIRAHAMSMASVRSDKAGFAVAAMELFQRYKTFRSIPDWGGAKSLASPTDPKTFKKDLIRKTKPSGVPLIIKLPSSTRGAVDECLHTLLKTLGQYLTEAVFLPSHTESPFNDKDLLRGCNLARFEADLPPFQVSDRFPSDLSNMKSLAYFHTATLPAPAPAYQTRWDSRSLSALHPLAVRYANTLSSPLDPPKLNTATSSPATTGPTNHLDTDILGFTILCPLPSSILEKHLASFINGSIVAITVISEAHLSTCGVVHHDPTSHIPYLAYSPSSTTTSAFSALASSSVGISPLPHPSESRTVGWALVRGIDPETGMLHLLTPLDAHILRNLPARRTILQAGLTAQPAWAFLESVNGVLEGNSSTTASGDNRFPWVRSTDDQGRSAFEGVTGQVLKIRGFGK